MEFKIGDVVMLKSGGPKMTIQNMGDYGHHDISHARGLWCVWFEGTSKIQGAFHPDSVESLK